jgi:GntR family transcriptional regulator
MRLRVSPDSAVPIYEQILSQVVFAVAAGDLPAGEAVPSVRELSQQLIVNANTVARAYQELERLGVVEARRGVGMFVTDGGPKVCRERRKVLVRDRVRETVREAAAAGLSAEELRQLVDDEWPRRNGTAKTPH